MCVTKIERSPRSHIQKHNSHVRPPEHQGTPCSCKWWHAEPRHRDRGTSPAPTVYIVLCFPSPPTLFHPYAPCGTHTTAPRICRLRSIVVDVVLGIATCLEEFRDERSLLVVFVKFFASSLEVFWCVTVPRNANS